MRETWLLISFVIVVAMLAVPLMFFVNWLLDVSERAKERRQAKRDQHEN